MVPQITSRKTIFYDNFVSFWSSHSKHSHQLGRIIPNIHVTLDHFRVTLDHFRVTLNISCHFGQCCKRPCFLLVNLGCHFNILLLSLVLQAPFEKSFETIHPYSNSCIRICTHLLHKYHSFYPTTLAIQIGSYQM